MQHHMPPRFLTDDLDWECNRHDNCRLQPSFSAQGELLRMISRRAQMTPVSALRRKVDHLVKRHAGLKENYRLQIFAFSSTRFLRRADKLPASASGVSIARS